MICQVNRAGSGDGRFSLSVGSGPGEGTPRGFSQRGLDRARGRREPSTGSFTAVARGLAGIVAQPPGAGCPEIFFPQVKAPGFGSPPGGPYWGSLGPPGDLALPGLAGRTPGVKPGGPPQVSGAHGDRRPPLGVLPPPGGVIWRNLGGPFLTTRFEIPLGGLPHL